MPLLFGYHHVPDALAALLDVASRLGPVAYFEAEFSGGRGAQASVVWREGHVTLGPIVEQEDEPPQTMSERTFNQALRVVGVRAQPGTIDEFRSGSAAVDSPRGWPS